MQSIRKIFGSIVLFSWFIVLALTLTLPKQIHTIEMLYQTASYEDALSIASAYEIDLDRYSDYGVSVFSVNSDDADMLLNEGFQYNQTYQTNSEIQAVTMNDTYFDNQYAIGLIGIDEAWALEMGDPDYLIAIIDTGIDTDHVEFSGRISSLSYNSTTDQVGISYVEDTVGHGTNVASIIAANSDNNIGVAGIVQNSELLVIKANEIDDPSTRRVNEAESFSDDSLIVAINYAVEKGADIINMSVGGAGYNSLFQDAVDDAYEAGVIIVSSSGNDGTTEAFYPASYNHVISVGAVDSDMIVADYSNHNVYVDLTAPGSSIPVLDNGDYVLGSGTSYATPQVVGAIALLQAYRPELSDDEIIQLIYDHVIDLGLTGRDTYYGEGMIHLYSAMTAQTLSVSFDTDGGNLISTISVPKDATLDIEDPVKTGYTFDGWYLDGAFTNPFLMNQDTVTEDMTLYAKFTINQYEVTFVSDPYIAPIMVNYNETFILPSLSKEGYTFGGWFLDQTFETPYVSDVVTNDLTLYALFEQSAYKVNFYVDDVIDQSVYIDFEDALTLYTPAGADTFIGWYLEPTFITIVTEGYVPVDDINLYARFDNGQFQVVYYDETNVVYQIQYVESGEDALTPEGPEKVSSASFDYTFDSWSISDQNVTEDLHIYPVYNISFIEGSVILNPGVDTVYQYESWIDNNLSFEDPLIEVVVVSVIDINTIGRYLITYHIYADDQLIKTLYRYVNVIEPSVTITLNPDVTTLYQGDVYEDQGATTNIGTLSVHGVVNTDEVGVYILTYEVTYQDEVYQKSKYVYVLEPIVYTESTETNYIIPRKEEWDI